MLRVDFTSQDYLRNLATGVTKLRAAGPVVQSALPDRRENLDHYNQRSGRPGSKGQRDIHDAQERQSCRSALVDARVATHARGQHADHGRARPYASAQHCRRSLSSPRHSRHGTENFRNCR